MGPVNKYRLFVSWFQQKLDQDPNLWNKFHSIQEWHDVFETCTMKPCHLNLHGFKKILNRLHGDAILDSKVFKDRNRNIIYLFRKKDLDLNTKELRNLSLPTSQSTITRKFNILTSSIESNDKVSEQLRLQDLLPQSTQQNGLVMLSNIALQLRDRFESAQTPPSSPTVITPTITPIVTPIVTPFVFSEDTLNYIESSNHLDFSKKTRPNVLRPSLPNVRIHNSKSLSEGLKWHLICQYMQHTKGTPGLVTWKQKTTIMNAIIKHESYHSGYKKPIIVCRTFTRYIQAYNSSKHTDQLFSVYTSRKGSNQVSYITSLERNFPKYMHKLYRYSCRLLGLDATVPQLIHCMNSRSRILHPHCPTRSDLRISIHHFWNFFYSNGGQLKRPTTKPSLTKEQKTLRVEWAKNMKQALELLEDFYCCFLDEKWFYTTSRRKKMKILPQADWENSKDAKIVMPKVHSRRHCSKVMYMGVIGAPVYKKNKYGEFEYEIVNGEVKKIILFDGKIMCKRVSQKVAQSQLSTHQNFVEEHILNDDIKKGEWKDLLVDPGNISVSEALDLIGAHYGMDDGTTDSLCFTYYSWKWVNKRKPRHQSSSHDNKKRKTKTKSSPPPVQIKPNISSASVVEDEPAVRVKQKVPIRIQRDEFYIFKDKYVTNQNMEKISLTMADLLLHVRVEKGTMVEKDCSCDSDFMIEHIHEIGKKIRKSYENVITSDKPIVLIMDNAGGHGRNDVKKEYEKILRLDYNVHVHWQVANSPETNLLDLGAWMALQSIVEKKHRLLVLNKDVLAKTVETAFPCLDDAVLTRIHERWIKVLDLIITDKGNNDMVEQDRGLKKNPMEVESGDVDDSEEDNIPCDD